MSRPLRIQYPGAYYHVYHCGLERRKIYQSPKDYEIFLRLLQQASTQFKFVIHAYCLMSNHYHMFVETPEGNLARGLRHLNGIYTQKYNQRYKRVGALFQGRYKAKLVEAVSYGLELGRYIHRNPVAAKMVRKPESYLYSSYGAYVGKRKAETFLETDWTLSQFAKRRSEAVKAFERFTLLEDSESWSPDEKTVSRVVIGTQEFFEKIRDRYLTGKADREFSELREVKRTIPIEKIEKFVKRLQGRSVEKKKWLVYALRKHTPLKLSEIGEKVGGVSYSGVSQTVRRLELAAGSDRGLAKILTQIDSEMSKVKT